MKRDDLKNRTNPLAAMFENYRKHSLELTSYSDHIKIYFMELAERAGMGKRSNYLPMNGNAEPVAQKPRRIAYHLMEPLQKRLQEFLEKDIMEKVPDQEPVTWCSPIVVQPKPKNPSDIRISLYLRILNKSMLRTRYVQAPIAEDFITALKGCSILSKLDLNHGYHQFVIDPRPRQAMTFSTRNEINALHSVE